MASNSIMKPFLRTHRRGAELLNSDSKTFGLIKVGSKKDLQKLFSYIYKNLALTGRYSGFKVHAKHIADLERRVNAKITKRELASLFPKNTKYIWLLRNDKVEQAVSYLVASKTKQWFIEDVKQKRDIRTFRLRIGDIKNAMSKLKSYDNYWGKFFKENKISPLVVYYEDLDNNPKATLKCIFEHLNIRKRGITLETTLIKQKDRHKTGIIKNAKKRLKLSSLHKEARYEQISTK